MIKWQVCNQTGDVVFAVVIADSERDAIHRDRAASRREHRSAHFRENTLT